MCVGDETTVIHSRCTIVQKQRAVGNTTDFKVRNFSAVIGMAVDADSARLSVLIGGDVSDRGGVTNRSYRDHKSLIGGDRTVSHRHCNGG